jgi:hypothetical protein
MQVRQEGWSDSQIAAALDTGLVTVARVRQQLVEEGFEAVLTPKRSPASARQHLRWCRRGQTNRAGLFDAAQGARTMDVASAGKQSRGTEHRCPGQRQHDRADAKKNILKPHLKEQWVIPPDANSLPLRRRGPHS